MKILVKQYRREKVEIAAKEIEIPEEPTHYFETGIRRSIRVVPYWTTWQQERHHKPEEIWQLEVTCVYLDFMCKVEKFTIPTSQLEEIYYSDHHKHKDFVQAMVNGWLDERAKEQFDADLDTAINLFKTHHS